MKKLYLDQACPAVYRSLNGTTEELSKVYETAGLDRSLIELVLIRASQLNRCPTCLSVHVPKGIAAGLSQRKIDLLPSWREADGVYSDEELAALELAETITLLPAHQRNSAAMDVAKKVFSDEQVAALAWAVILIGAYNRLSIFSQHPPAKY